MIYTQGNIQRTVTDTENDAITKGEREVKTRLTAAPSVIFHVLTPFLKIQMTTTREIKNNKENLVPPKSINFLPLSQ